MSVINRARLATIGGIVIICGTDASGDPRPFTFSNDTYPVGKGNWEYEQWVTWQKHKENETRFDQVVFRHEFEFGLADNFDLALYLPSWSYEDTDEHAG